MTKKSISRLLQASLMCCLAVLFTACDDIFASEDNPTPAYLSMSDKPVTIKVGDTYRRKAISVTTAVVEYTSSDTNVATVDGEGVVTAIAEGEATITATATGYSTGGKKIYQPASVSYVVTVTPATVSATSLTLNKTMEVLVKNGDALTITATATPAEATFTWESSDANVATVENGVVTPVGAGIATITAKSGDVKATCEVFVGNEVDVSSGNPIQNFDILKGTQNSSSITIPDGCKVAFNGVTTNKQIICEGTATIILADGSTNTATAGIKIGGEGTTLTINAETAGTGKLTAQGANNSAGIGTNENSSGGNIVINGGTVKATSSSGAGIGTGVADESTNKCGTITINGGTVTAEGGIASAGIGTGAALSMTNTCTNTCDGITINGGTVNATGGYWAAGIGTGYAAQSTNECGAITIGTGVTSVTATKNSVLPGPYSIGKGDDASGGTQICGTITIGGVVKAQSDFTAATYTYEP